MDFLTKLLVLLIWLSSSSVAAAPFKEGEFSDEDLLVVSRMAVLESGWTRRREHVAQAFIQLKRWRRTRDDHPHYRDQVIGYCPGLRHTHKRRQRWVSELNLAGDRPPSFPSKLNWDRHKRWWFKVIHNLRKWSEGKRGDPYRGRAWHWRSPEDPETTLPLLRKIPEFGNYYYGRRVR